MVDPGPTSSVALSLRQVAEELNVNERTVYRLARSGKLPAFRVAGSWRVLRSDLDQWIAAQKRAAQVAAKDDVRHG